MYWNHRIVDMSDENQGEPWLEVREVFYEEDGMRMGHTEICTGNETLEGLKEQFTLMLEAIDTAIKIGNATVSQPLAAVLKPEHFSLMGAAGLRKLVEELDKLDRERKIRHDKDD